MYDVHVNDICVRMYVCVCVCVYTTGLRGVARNWFAFDSEFKRKFKLGPSTFYRGYQSLGDNVTRHEDGFTRDMHEAIDLYRPVRDEDDASTSGEDSILKPTIDSPLHGPNPTSFGYERMDVMLDEYIGEMLRLSKTIMRGLATGYGVDEDAFIRAGVGDESYWVMRVINYPPLTSQAPDDSWNREIDKRIALSCGEHSDYGLSLSPLAPALPALQTRSTLLCSARRERRRDSLMPAASVLSV